MLFWVAMHGPASRTSPATIIRSRSQGWRKARLRAAGHGSLRDFIAAAVSVNLQLAMVAKASRRRGADRRPQSSEAGHSVRPLHLGLPPVRTGGVDRR
jgi:hypothetical protein